MGILFPTSNHASRIFNVVQSGLKPAGIDPHVTRSWLRCVKEYGIEPSSPRQNSVLDPQTVREAQQRMGHLVVKAQLPRIGWNKSTSYEGDGWAIVRDTDSSVVKQALFDLITTVKVRYAS